MAKREEPKRLQIQIFITRYPGQTFHTEIAARKNMDSMEGVLKGNMSPSTFAWWLDHGLPSQLRSIMQGGIDDLWGDVLSQPTLDDVARVRD